MQQEQKTEGSRAMDVYILVEVESEYGHPVFVDVFESLPAAQRAPKLNEKPGHPGDLDTEWEDVRTSSLSHQYLMQLHEEGLIEWEEAFWIADERAKSEALLFSTPPERWVAYADHTAYNIIKTEVKGASTDILTHLTTQSNTS